MFRVSVDKQIRKAGVAAKLMGKIEDVAKDLRCREIEASTSSAQKGALLFYPKIGYEKVSQDFFPQHIFYFKVGEFGYSWFTLNNIKMIKFVKNVEILN